MHEFSVPVAYVVKPDDNITDDVFTNAENWPDTVGLKRRVGGTWTPVTWREFAEQVCDIA
jgi:long-chain acyl-CoA synthetase